MAGPFEKTNYRASPEDAVFYHKHRFQALASLQGGTSREDLIRDLLSKGVPQRTAERIVTAVEQEHAVKSSPPHTVPHMKLWLAYMLGPTFILALSTYFTIGISQDRSLKANKYLIVAM